MPRVTAIKNLTVIAGGSATPFWKSTSWGWDPHEAIVRQISYSGSDAFLPGTFLVWCSLIQGHIGTFQVGQYGATTHPKIQILIPSAMPTSLEFRIDTVQADGTTAPYTGLVGDISIHIDFLKY
jgi:hypothetical protein